MIHEVLGIDTGERETGWARVQMDGDEIKVASGVRDNDEMLLQLRNANCPVALEKVQCTGRAGKAIGNTIFWLGQFHEAAKRANVAVTLVHRNSVLGYFRASAVYNKNGDRMKNDAALLYRLIERFGKSIVPKSSHERSAMAVALVVLAEITEDSQ